MEEWLLELVTLYSFVTLKTIGYSTEGRPVYVVQIEPKNAQKKPIIFVEAGAHAREWIGQAVALALIERLIAERDSGMGFLMMDFR